MKKILAVLLALAMILSFAACGSSSSEPAPAGQSGTNEDNPSSNSNVENPWTEVSADDIYSKLNYRFGIPEGASDVVYRWNENDGIAEMLFTVDGIEMTARAKKTDAFEDISGMYYDFSDNDDNYGHGPDCFIWNNDQELRGDYHLLATDDGCVSLGLWYYVSMAGNYSLSLGYVADGFSGMSQYASEVFILDSIEGDPAEYSQSYWEEKYPDYMFCPFYIEENGVEKNYYWPMGYEGLDGTMSAWIECPFNWNGWHKTDDGCIVNEAETLKLTDDWAEGESMSSCCTVTTEPYSGGSAQGSDVSTPTTSYNFKGYTETADWPEEDMWTSYGLPVLPMSDDVNGTVHISDKEWIYPLNGSDGIMVEARPEASQIDAIVDTLKDAGIEMEEDMDFENGYTAYYDNGSDEMKITVSETGSGKLTVTIITNPTD